MSIIGWVAFIICLLLLGTLLFYLFWNLVYWYENMNTGRCLIPLPKPGVRVCVSTYIICTCGGLACLFLRPFGPMLSLSPRAGRGAELTRPPLVFIHGLGCNSSVWIYLARKMQKQGYNVSTFSYSSFRAPLQKIMTELDEHMKRVGRLNPGNRPVVIGHSLGGILARAWLLNPAAHERTGGLITLGGPHGGSKLAVFALGKLSKNLLPDSELMAALAAAPDLPFPCIAVASPVDEAVLPADNLVPPIKQQGNWQLRISPPVGHLSMLFHPGVAKMVSEAMQNMFSPSRG